MRPEAVTVLENLLTSEVIARAFNRTPLTIINWRKYEGLPYVRIGGEGRDAIRFEVDAIRAWARETGRTLDESKLPHGFPQPPQPRKRLDDDVPEGAAAVASAA